MKLLIVLITYNRLDYTKRTLNNLRDSISDGADYFLCVCDNNSSDGTQKYLKSLEKRRMIDKLILNPENYYPGKATNIGWEQSLKHYPEATHLMRLDNDMHFEKDWDVAAESYFQAIPELGQLGLDDDALNHPSAALRVLQINGKEINPWPGCVGGPSIVRRSIYDTGVRYEELEWDDGRNTPFQEDSRFSRLVMNRGYMVGHMTDRLAWTFANEDNWSDYPDYYLRTMANRGYDENVKKIKKL